MTTDLVVATRNKKKLAEIKDLLAGLHFNVLSTDDFPHIPEIEEDGETFEENALKKASEVAKITKKLTIADDSGLVIDHLDGKPGIHSARFAGENANDEDKNKKVLTLMKGVTMEKRTARFVCAVAIVNLKGENSIVKGIREGIITTEPKGTEGFGYDPIFLIPEYGKTYAELGVEMKNRISHRAKALDKTKKVLISSFL
ncbi:XTP/dITP diphosphatase [Candidatus Poribacteria bacterium]|nr:XTP/dITP diphosphatase [Candidatus Poribacteria bacterium]